jgi:hypothetical protein
MIPYLSRAVLTYWPTKRNCGLGSAACDGLLLFLEGLGSIRHWLRWRTTRVKKRIKSWSALTGYPAWALSSLVLSSFGHDQIDGHFPNPSQIPKTSSQFRSPKSPRVVIAHTTIKITSKTTTHQSALHRRPVIQCASVWCPSYPSY